MSTASTTEPRRTKTLAALTIVITFVCGFAVGVFSDHLWLLHMRRPLFHGRALAPRIVAHLDRVLDLTPDQRREVARILERHHVRIEAINSGVRPQVRREIELANSEIEKILTPEQRVKFAKLKLRILRRPPGSPGPGGEAPPGPPPAAAP
jgi:hypothetical protein